MNNREINLIEDAISTHLRLMVDMENNPMEEDRMRQYKALLLKIAPVK